MSPTSMAHRPLYRRSQDGSRPVVERTASRMSNCMRTNAKASSKLRTSERGDGRWS